MRDVEEVALCMKRHAKLMSRSKGSGEVAGPRRKTFCFQVYGAPVGFLTVPNHVISGVSVSLPSSPSNLTPKATRREQEWRAICKSKMTDLK